MFSAWQPCSRSKLGYLLSYMSRIIVFIEIYILKEIVMDIYAVIETGGKQYLVKDNDTLSVEKIEGEAGTKVELSVLAVSDGKELKVGTPVVEGSTVTTSIVEQTKGVKVINFKKKRRKGYSRKVGHRQKLTVLKVESISA
jgi:large subunit ribosomal protein L21